MMPDRVPTWLKARKFYQLILLGLAGVFFAMQLWPVDRRNPPVTGDLEAPADVKAILRRACYDCHSNETHWPWYAYIAPASWLVAYDVHEGREHVNFSHWDQYDQRKRYHVMGEAFEEVEAGNMPLDVYMPLHPEAKISEADLKVLEAWAYGE